MALTAWVTMMYIETIKKGQEDLVRSNGENLKLYEKVVDFNRTLEQKVAAATKEISKCNQENTGLYLKYHGLFIDVVKVLAVAVEVRDPYIKGHAERVTNFSQAIFEELNSIPGIKIPPELRGTLYMACMMQDIGRLAIRDEILRKNGPLTNEEWLEMKKHPIVGAHIIGQVEELKPVAEAILFHRERYDGTGYPKNLKGDQIPLVSRIIAVADAFDAMTSERPFRLRKDDSTAVEEIKKGMNAQFDPNVVQAFLRAYQKGKIVKI
jgi:HD-GYP domain-containing protein (c-di-GMP phosphodiesterase class II)